MATLIVVGVIALMSFGVLGFVVIAKVERDQKKSETNAEPALDELFDGRDDVTFSGHMRTMKYETVIVGAKKRGYKLEHQAGDPKGAFTLIFAKG